MQVTSRTVTDISDNSESVDVDEKMSAAKQGEEILHSMPLLNLNAGRQAIVKYFENTWSLTEMLFSSLKNDDAFFIRPYHKTRHPMIFYYTHPVCFYVNKLLISGLIKEPVNPDFELLFETGVDEMNWDDLYEGDQDIWPSLQAVVEYRQQVYDLVHELINTHPCFNQPITMDSQGWALVMAFEHERIHLETSSVLIRELPLEHVRTPRRWPHFPAQKLADRSRPVAGKDYPADNPMLNIKQCKITLGKPKAWPSFGWDNEYGSDQRQVPSFRAGKFLVSNGEFFEFVKDLGYETSRYWSESGWRWRQFRNIKWPTFWIQDGPSGSHCYKLRTVFSLVDMQWDWPAIVNYYEARAYCAWLTEKSGTDKPYRLLQEAEQLAIREPETNEAVRWQTNNNSLLKFDGVMNNDPTQDANLNLRYGSEGPVDAMPANSPGIHDAMGNVWQWSEDCFHPLTGFDIHPYYTDFSTPCFDGKHQMIMGGSFISTGDEASIWSRFHFRPHFFQHAGFRLAQSNEDREQEQNKYETRALIDQYLLFHYGSLKEQRDEIISAQINFPEAGSFVLHTATLMSRFAAKKTSALDLGCALGRASFELARDFSEVIGLDFSRSFIDIASQLKQDGQLAYSRIETGNHFTNLQATVADDIDRSKVKFISGDACSLERDLHRHPNKPFDAILLANLLCRLADPEACLRQFVETDNWLKDQGVLVIASPNTWSKQYTDEGKFLDGKGSDDTITHLSNILSGFELIFEEDYPFMIREHRRKYEYIISQITVWKKIRPENQGT